MNLHGRQLVSLDRSSGWVGVQAMDRAHRIGQKKEVQVFRFCVDNSIEEKVCSNCQLAFTWGLNQMRVLLTLHLQLSLANLNGSTAPTVVQLLPCTTCMELGILLCWVEKTRPQRLWSFVTGIGTRHQYRLLSLLHVVRMVETRL